ncbi:hypothetical protein C8F04DRAFT_1271634 [Mycena alexandri]|uniref:Bacteriophage T5 Orf172 DNA-binding domain-containing protein n=1 Tax=Mycena alexandri TaxID=1745969 RepID=A0AAD6WS29_9AGAR|nr:hypothetical protein C8F04DRAFT_1271634 [Mycena alexandri]
MSRSAPFIAARAANVDLRTLVDPYVRDRPGLVYSNLRVPTWAFKSWRAGTLSTGAFRRLLEIKVGHTDNFRRRRSQYNRCCRGWFTIIWIAHFWMRRRILLECLVHTSIRLRGAVPKRVRCGCGVRHREYVSYLAAGGIAAVEQDIVSWKGLFGEAANKTVL